MFSQSSSGKNLHAYWDMAICVLLHKWEKVNTWRALHLSQWVQPRQAQANHSHPAMPTIKYLCPLLVQEAAAGTAGSWASTSQGKESQSEAGNKVTKYRTSQVKWASLSPSMCWYTVTSDNAPPGPPSVCGVCMLCLCCVGFPPGTPVSRLRPKINSWWTGVSICALWWISIPFHLFSYPACLGISFGLITALVKWLEVGLSQSRLCAKA